MAKRKKDKRQDASAPGKSPASPSAPATAAEGGRLVELMRSGDNRAARAEAQRVLADPAASEADRAAARDILQRTSPDRVVLAVGLLAIAVVASLAALLLLR